VLLTFLYAQLDFLLNTPATKSIVIIGGGASATLLIAQLSIQLNRSQPVNIYIIDDSDAYKVGCAYQVQHPSFLLNVTADKMGAYHDKPDDFYYWLKNYPGLWRNSHADFSSVEFQPGDFVPRMIYGLYLSFVFDQAVALAAQKNIFVRRVFAHATKITTFENTTQLHIHTNSHESIIADTLVLATGNSWQNHKELIGANIFSSPYCNTFLQHDWSNTKNIIILGSGLSMVDAVQYLTQQHYQGEIHILSRHGLIPFPHLATHKIHDAQIFGVSHLSTARKIVRKLREQISNNLAQGISWQATINAFRTQANSIWLSLSETEQKKLQRFLPWWNVARHRIPVKIYDDLVNLKKQGRLVIIKGDLKKAESDGEYFLLKLKNKTLFIKSEKMVICSGYNYKCNHLMEACEDLFASKRHSIHAIGPALAGMLFETTAIHEIRQQAKTIAQDVNNEIGLASLCYNSNTI